VRGGTVPALHPDFVAGATISARAMRGAVADAARLVLRARSAVPQVSARRSIASSIGACHGTTCWPKVRWCGGRSRRAKSQRRSARKRPRTRP
jgi:hypothetical protein